MNIELAVIFGLSLLSSDVWAVKPSSVPFEIQLEGKTVFTESDIQKAMAVNTERTKKKSIVAKSWEVQILLSPGPAELLKSLTTQTIGKQLTLLVDGKRITSPEIKIPIESGAIALPAIYTEKVAKEIARDIVPTYRQEGVLSEDSAFAFRYYRAKERHRLILIRLPISNAYQTPETLDSVSEPVKKGDRFVYNEEIFCSKGKEVVYALIKGNEEKGKRPFHPRRAWGIDIDALKFISLKNEDVACIHK